MKIQQFPHIKGIWKCGKLISDVWLNEFRTEMQGFPFIFVLGKVDTASVFYLKIKTLKSLDPSDTLLYVYEI